MTETPGEPGPADPYGTTPPPAPPGYGAPPPAAPYGAPPPGSPYGGAPSPGYGAPPPPGYGSPSFGAMPPPPYEPSPGPGGTLADWPLRAKSTLVDWFGPAVVANIVLRINRPLGLLLILASFAWALYQAYPGGKTGQSAGRKWAGTRLVSERTGQPPGGALGIGRYFLHVVDAIICYIGFLFPLWDSKRQTLADKILSTVVVRV